MLETDFLNARVQYEEKIIRIQVMWAFSNSRQITREANGVLIGGETIDEVNSMLSRSASRVSGKRDGTTFDFMMIAKKIVELIGDGEKVILSNDGVAHFMKWIYARLLTEKLEEMKIREKMTYEEAHSVFFEYFVIGPVMEQ